MSGQISSVTSASSTYTNATVDTGNSSLLSKDAFLKLLITQMQNQDPLEPMDNSQQISQMAQLSTMESLQNLNDQFTVNAGFAEHVHRHGHGGQADYLHRLGRARPRRPGWWTRCTCPVASSTWRWTAPRWLWAA